MGKGTPSMGKRSAKRSHIKCRRCGKSAYHVSTRVCASCGYGKSTRLRTYTWVSK
ncbi:50S ribosomal protein L37e [Candidatus Woesearchaeota archaeon CG_4_10_14_0_2_um_filter_57_5]|nr:MAG: 50S ribosomal protein L37e [Candidatus Woesearchaeota archaeon CG11_big_fil_rev_8_21_14_0_20_57_5]PIZ50220.1 MAG: 50S ribosomal protein L37e [Candidatus Woesearchaeota archaeon CG_4_10_14_0_2_um_filter_57_5]